MLKKTITYTDYNGETRTEDFYFNFTKAELVQLQFGTIGGLDKLIGKIVSTKSEPELIELFKMIIDKSYGQKSPDGRRFIKNKDVLDDFVQTEAYSELFMELATNDKAAADFCNGLIPDSIRKEISSKETTLMMASKK